jgi:hypothetical protein
MNAPTHLTEARPEGPTLSLERRASLARETLRLIRSIADSLGRDAEQARLHCAFAGDPKPIAQELDTLVELSGALRRQGDQLTRAFAVLDRLFPPDTPAEDQNGASEPPTGWRAGAPWITEEEIPEPPALAVDLPETPAPEEEDRATAASFAVALKLDGASREQVEARLAREFGRPDAPQIAEEAFRV